MVRWSVGGDPRAPLLLTQEVSAGGQVVSPEPPCCSRWESLQVACLPRLPLLQVPVVALMLLA